MKYDEWNKWDEIDNKRIEKAKGKDLTPLVFDRENETAIFASSDGGTYNTTLSSCDCVDFSRHQGMMPCKHICRLAMELGVIDDSGMQSDIASAKHKLDRANLISLARDGELIPTACFFQVMEKILNKEQIRYDAFVEQYGEVYAVSSLKSGKCKIDKQYAADIKSAYGIVSGRIGELCMQFIDSLEIQTALQNEIQKRLTSAEK